MNSIVEQADYKKNEGPIGEKEWQAGLKILSEFGHKLEGQISIETQNYLWENIINIKNNLQEDINQTIRINLQLCYMVEAHDQVKEINYPLFRLNHLFDHDFYHFNDNSFLGLKRFFKMINSTYGGVENFISDLKKVKENLYFVRKRYDELLVKDYLYLKKLSLPLRGYEDLRIAVFTILKKITHLKSIVSKPRIFIDLKEEITDFKDLYKETYIKEHQQFQEKLSEFNRELHLLKEYRILQNLSDIKAIKVAYNLKPIKKYIDTFFPEQCHYKALNDILDKQPKCSCGFTLGESLTIPSLNKIKPMLKKGINEYIEQLTGNKFRKLLKNYLKFKPESTVKSILKIEENNYQEIDELIKPELVEEINDALSNTYPINISFEEIYSGIIGTYPINQIDQITSRFKEILESYISKEAVNLQDVNSDDLIINIMK